MNLPEKMNSKLAITVANEVLADCRTIKEAIDELHLLRNNRQELLTLAARKFVELGTSISIGGLLTT